MKRYSRSEWNRYREVRINDAKNLEREGRLDSDPYLKKILQNERQDQKNRESWRRK